MDNVNYDELKIQDYFSLKGTQVDHIRNIFKLRTRMAPFGNNFKGNKPSISCPLCDMSEDTQGHGFRCKAITDEIEINLDINEIYRGGITREEAETATKVLAKREELLENMRFCVRRKSL